MPASAEKCVKTCIQKIKDTFEGFDEAVVEEFYNIMIDEVRSLCEEVRRESMAAVARGVSAEPEKPKLKRVSNYTLFGQNFRKENPDIKEDMFKRIADAWRDLSSDEKEEWKRKADEVNAAEKEAYVKLHGEPPKKQKLKHKLKRTHAFRVFTAEYRTKNPKVDHKEVFGKASEAFKKLSAKQQQKYQDEADKLNAQYKEEHDKWLQEHPEEAIVAQVTGKQKKEKKLAPKKRSGYLLFGDDWRDKLNKDDLKGKDAMKAIGEAWRGLAQKDKTKYETKAKKDNEKIVADFVKTNPDCEWTRKHQAESTTA